MSIDQIKALQASKTELQKSLSNLTKMSKSNLTGASHYTIFSLGQLFGETARAITLLERDISDLQKGSPFHGE